MNGSLNSLQKFAATLGLLSALGMAACIVVGRMDLQDQTLAEFSHQYAGPWVWVLIAGMIAFVNIFAIPIAIPLIPTVILGSLGHILAIDLWALICSGIGHWVGRSLTRVPSGNPEAIETLRTAAKRNPWKAAILSRAGIGLPHASQNLAAGAVGIPLQHFLLATVGSLTVATSTHYYLFRVGVGNHMTINEVADKGQWGALVVLVLCVFLYFYGQKKGV